MAKIVKTGISPLNIKKEMREKEIERQKAERKSSVPDEHKIIKKDKSDTTKKNHYLPKDEIAKKLVVYRQLHLMGQGKSDICKCKNPMCRELLLLELKKRKDDLIKDFEKVCKHLIKGFKFNRKPLDQKQDMIQTAIMQMYYYDYFWKFDIEKTEEGFSYLTSIAYNFFIQAINYFRDYLTLRISFRGAKIEEFENTNQALDLSDLSQGSLVKGLNYSYEDVSVEE